MNKLTVIIVALLVIVGGFLFYNLSQSNNSDIVSLDDGISAGNSGEVFGESEMIAETPEQTTNPKTYAIEIKSFSFQNQELTINSGDTVIWTNMDSVSHTITSDSGSELNSNYLSKSQSYSHTFTQAGTYDYHCAPHPYMKGKIIVN
ncbi:cupredoxin family copper-binding protein [Candidatus Pacearchaeota archaeon]|nr:cupredoxin family copper-binding protein [Candidatus Pacearchaeota archaeon]